MTFATLRAAAAALLMLVAAAPAVAQAPAPQSEKPPRDPQLVAMAREYVRAIELPAGFAASLPQIAAQLVRQTAQRNPQVAPEVIQSFSDALFDEFLIKHSQQIEALVVESVLDTFTRDEIQALRTFWTSPTGRAIHQKQSTLLQKLPNAMQEWVRATIPDAARAAAARVKAQNKVDLRM